MNMKPLIMPINNLSEEEKQKYIDQKIKELLDSDYSYDIIAHLLNVPLERVYGISY